MSYKEDHMGKLEEYLDRQQQQAKEQKAMNVDSSSSSQDAPKQEQDGGASAGKPQLSREDKKKLKEQKKSMSKEDLIKAKEERKRQFEQQMEQKRKQREEQAKKKQEGTSGGAQPVSTPSTPTLHTSNISAKEQQANAEEIAQKNAEIARLEKIVEAQTKRLTENRIYSHLTPFKSITERNQIPINYDAYHPAIVTLGLQYANGFIHGGNARCLAFMNALRQVVIDYKTPEDKVLNRDLDSQLIPQIDFLKKCRPMSIGMGNALKNFKFELHRLDPRLPEHEAKEYLVDVIDRWVSEKIEYTMKSIVEKGVQKIQNGDVILTYARSEVVERILLAAKEEGKQFSVVVVNSRPKNEGRELLQILSSAGIKCSFCLINAVSYMMKEVTSVMLGAHGMLSNGSVLSRIGTAMVCLAARSFNKPVLVCCETYKFSDRSQLDSMTRNEISDPEELTIPDREVIRQKFVKMGMYGNNGQYQGSVLNLTYDVTPGEWVDVVITEVGLLPCTSVPVILREIYAQNNA